MIKTFYTILFLSFLFAILLGIYAGYKADWKMCDDPQVCTN